MAVMLSSMRDVIRVRVAVVVVLMVVVGVLCIGTAGVTCTGVVDILVLGGVFVVEVVKEVDLVVGCVVRLVPWCCNLRGEFS